MNATEQINTTIARHGMTDKQACVYLGVPRMTLRNWRTGARKPPTVVMRLIEVLGLIEAMAPEIHAALIPDADSK